MVSSGKFIGGVLLAALVWTAVWVPGFGHATSHVSTVVDTGPGAWTEVSPPLSPPAMAGAMMAYSSKSDRFVLFGGWDGVTSLNATWQYDPENRSWMDLHPPTHPIDRGDGMFVYDSVSDVFVLFGGWHQEPNGTYLRLHDTWVFSLSADTWTQRHPARSPTPRSDAGVAYDPVADAVLLVGGFNGTGYLGDVWSYSPGSDAWSQRPSTVQPSPRADGRMVYMPGIDRFILFGGNDYSGPNFAFHHLADTWSYAWGANAWTNLTRANGPSARDYAIMAADPISGRVLMTSGFGDGTPLNDLWSFNLTDESWIPLNAGGAPPSRFAGVGGFDSLANLLVVFGGATSTGLLGDTWYYNPHAVSPDATPLWLPIAIAAIILAAEGIAVAVFLRRNARRP